MEVFLVDFLNHCFPIVDYFGSSLPIKYPTLSLQEGNALIAAQK